MLAKTFIERFEEKYIVDPNSGCWLWTAAVDPRGYGVFQGYAHRWSHELYIGPIPRGLVIDHKCSTPACVNPSHLEAVSQRENVNRGRSAEAARARGAARTHCKNGHPFSEENTYLANDRRGPHRQCKICRTANMARLRRLWGANKKPKAASCSI